MELGSRIEEYPTIGEPGKRSAIASTVCRARISGSSMEMTTTSGSLDFARETA
jgi:hypothetical protein